MKTNRPITVQRDHPCQICKTRFTLKRNLTKHLKVIHNIILQTEDVKNGLHCPLDCQPPFITRKYAILREHIYSCHGLHIECEELTFQSLEEFTSWKNCIEKETVCSYISQTAPKLLSFGQKKTYYVCHRSGLARKASTAIRSQASYKVGSHCPSTLDLTEDEGKFHVRFFKTHAGHDSERATLKLTREERTDLAGNEEIDEVWDERADDNTLMRKLAPSRNDLRNIKFGPRNRDKVTDNMETSDNAMSSIGHKKLKRKLNTTVEPDEDSCSNVDQTQDVSIEFIMERKVAGKPWPHAPTVRSARPNAFCVANTIGNLGLNVFQCEIGNRAAQGDSASPLSEVAGTTSVEGARFGTTKRKPTKRLLPKPEIVAAADEPLPGNLAVLPETSSEVRDLRTFTIEHVESLNQYSNANKRINVPAVPTASTGARVERPALYRYGRRNKCIEEAVITLRKRMCDNTSTVRVFTVDDKDGKTLDVADFEV